MASRLKSQLGFKLTIEKAYQNFKKSPQDRLAKESYLTTRLETLEEHWKAVNENHKKLTEETDATIESKYFKENINEDIEEAYITYKSELKEGLSIFKTSNKLCKSTSVNKSDCSVKLPKITIPVFSGLYSEWPTFRDLFTSLIHKNSTLDEVQKLHYLKGHLSGEAEQLLRHVPITSASYNESWTVLSNRYNNKKYLANGLLGRFMDQPKIVIESSEALKNLLDITNDTLSGLYNLGIPVNSWDVIVIHIICTKLDPESRKQWEAKISASDDLPTIQQMREFLETRFRSLEFLSVKKQIKPALSQKSKAMHAVASNSSGSSKGNMTLKCSYCMAQDHKITNCKEFKKNDCKDRRSFVQSNKLCFGCLGKNHSVKVCRSKTRCWICQHKHHSLLHPESITETFNKNLPTPDSIIAPKVKTIIENPASITNVVTHFSKETTPKQILLATAIIKAQAKDGSMHLLRALLDQGSQASFITASSAQLLGLKKKPNRSVISGLGGDKDSLTAKWMVAVTIQSRHDHTFQMEVQAHVLGSITSLLPSKKIACVDWPELSEMMLADPEYSIPSKIDILLGADVYGHVMRNGLVQDPSGGLTAQFTALGWILSGPTHQCEDDHFNSEHCHHNIILNMHTHVDDNELLKRFWQIESDTFSTKSLTEEEQLCEELYAKTTQRDSTGRYIVNLPFREDDPQCKYGNSKIIAIKRFRLLEHRFKKTPDIKNRYTEVMREYIELGHMERITNNEDKSEGVYLPHHAVIREDRTTTKVRIVFDASCKGTNGVSLNDSLMIGPTLQQDLRHIIMRWRIYPICLSADLVKMYRMVLVSKNHTDFQRLVWRDDEESEIEEYRLLRVTFGTASAPYLAVKTLQQLAIDEGKKYPETAKRIKTDFYVDDLLTGCETVEDGTRIFTEMTETLSKGGFKLQKWITNNKELAAVIENSQEIQKEGIDIKMDEVVKVLGLSWDKSSDSFRYSVQLPILQNPITKRKVVSDISRLFDPLGLAAPFVVVAKIMIQKLWLAGIDWDDELPNDLVQEWINYRSDLERISNLSVPRWVNTKVDDVHKELHGFCDASQLAYSAAVYLRNIDACGNIYVNLIAAKTKVAPIMQVSIPRLELMGAVLLARLITEVSNVLDIDSTNAHGWTDSTVVLAWLSSHPSRWTTFIGNRTSEILSKMDNSHWSHVQSADNPADIASRGCTSVELAESTLWLQGPSWLKSTIIEYRRPGSISTTLEQKRIKAHVTIKEMNKTAIWTRFSSLQRLVRVVAFCRRFLKLRDVRLGNHHFEPYLFNSELCEALEVCVRQCQITELDLSKLKPLYPYNDDKGILRAQGRIHNSDLSDEVKHPIILPQKSHFTDLIIDDAHKRTLHGGPSLMLNYLRSKYWVIGARALVRKHVHKCVTCIRYTAATKTQLMGQLPPARVTPAKPFLRSGVDFAGPINVRLSKGRSNKSYKSYICLFVCMVTKAIHLEVVSDLSAEGFIAAFKRFVARRGYVSDIWSDNGTNFLGASKELKRLVDAEQSVIAVEIKAWLNNNSVTWHFIPPHAPNFGGLWEAGVKSTKFHLKRVIGDTTLTYEEMATVLSQIEACLNSRPLSMLPKDNKDPAPLTPGHFLVGEPLIIVPERNYEQSSISTLKRWQMTQKMVQYFWRKWSNEYLVQCLQRYKWSKLNSEPKIGDVVLIKEDNLPPARWLLGKIEAKHPGLDEITRVVTLRCNGSLLKRPITKLCVLPVTD